MSTTVNKLQLRERWKRAVRACVVTWAIVPRPRGDGTSLLRWMAASEQHVRRAERAESRSCLAKRKDTAAVGGGPERPRARSSSRARKEKRKTPLPRRWRRTCDV